MLSKFSTFMVFDFTGAKVCSQQELLAELCVLCRTAIVRGGFAKWLNRVHLKSDRRGLATRVISAVCHSRVVWDGLVIWSESLPLSICCFCGMVFQWHCNYASTCFAAVGPTIPIVLYVWPDRWHVNMLFVQDKHSVCDVTSWFVDFSSETSVTRSALWSSRAWFFLNPPWWTWSESDLEHCRPCERSVGSN